MRGAAVCGVALLVLAARFAVAEEPPPSPPPSPVGASAKEAFDTGASTSFTLPAVGEAGKVRPFEAANLGLQLCLESDRSRGGYVSNGTVFRSGRDRVRLRIETNRRAFIALVNRTPDGRVQLLLPEPGRKSGDHLLAARQARYFPADDGWIVFDPPAGQETLQVIAARSQGDLDARVAELLAAGPAAQWPSDAHSGPSANRPGSKDLRIEREDPSDGCAYAVDPAGRLAEHELRLRHEP